MMLLIMCNVGFIAVAGGGDVRGMRFLLRTELRRSIAEETPLINVVSLAICIYGLGQVSKRSDR